MWLRSENFVDGQPIPGDNAFCIPADQGHVTFAANRNPQLSWGEVPDGIESFALTVIDIDAPTVGDDVNQEGREVPADLPRANFTHWLIADLPADTRSVADGTYSSGVVPRGKPGLSGRPSEGTNDYTGWFAGDPDMAGTYRGYDGPCPPWNDSIVHHYVFTLHSLDVPSLDLTPGFTAGDLEAAMIGHVLESASIIGTYALNPRL